MKTSFLLLLALASAACSSTILVEKPPRMVLDRARTFGIVRFDVVGDPGAPDVSSRFLEAIQHGQPGVAVVELGSAPEVLAAVGKTTLDGDAVREIGTTVEGDAVLRGAMTMEESKPKVDVDFSRGIDAGSVQAQVRLDGSLQAKLVDAGRGATLWSGSSSRWIQLACVGGTTGGTGSLRLPDRE